MLPKVAIICANYNYGDFILAAMESIQKQYYQGEIRLYVVDDGSSDNSWEIISEFAESDPEFVFAKRIEMPIIQKRLRNW
jgi:glycosyltransferase involved in cell wall biosynthesis